MLDNATDVVSRDLDTDVESTILSSLSGVAGMSIASVGGFVYFAFHDSSGDGTEQAYVWDGLFTSAVAHMEPCFQRPLKDSEFGLTDLGVVVPNGFTAPTLGDHNIAVVITTRNGYETKPAPVDTSAVLQPLTITCDGTQAYRITLTPVGTWPDWVDRAYLLATTVSNRERYYFVPDVWGQLAGGSGIGLNLTFAHTDVVLEGGRDATELFDLLSQEMDGTGPFDVAHVVQGSDRMCYLAYTLGQLGHNQSAIFISDKNKFQNITLSQHMRQLPGNKDIITACWIGNGLYLYGPYYTGSLRDNNLLPTEWGSVEMLDGNIGTRWIHGVTQDPTRSYVWVADQSGLYNFNGAQYPLHPISFEQGWDDWQAINQTAPPHTLRVLEDPLEHLVMVVAPMDDSDVATHVLVWDYSAAGNPQTGIDYKRVKYSKWNLTGIDIGGADRVRNPDTNITELWLGRETSTGDILRFKSKGESNLYRDGSLGIPWEYETPLLIFTSDAWLDFIAASITASGNGLLLSTARGLNEEDVDMIPLDDISLVTSALQPHLLGMDIQSNAISILLQGTGAVDNYAIIDFIRVYYNKISDHID
jgi:hypothetical protein